MGMKSVKEDEIFDIIEKSSRIQTLIKQIVGQDNTSSNIDVGKYTVQISELKLQLSQTNDKLEQYKSFYNQASLKLREYDALNNKVNSLEEKDRKNIAVIQENKSYIEKLETEISSLRNDIAESNEKLNEAQNKIDNLKGQFEVPLKYFELYKEISYSVRDGLENVISDDNVISFIISCSSESNLSSIWEYLKELSNNENDDFKNLSAIFDYFFDKYNESLPDPKYVRDDVEIGDDMDEEDYDRSFDSSTSGTIKKVVLLGYKSCNTGKIIHKSIVKA